MFKLKSIREKLLVGIFLGCFIPYLIGGYYLDRFAENWIYNDEIEHIEQLLQQTSIMVDESFIKKMEELTRFISDDERLIENSTDIRSYLDYSPQTLQEMPVSIEEIQIQSLFENIRKTNENINFIFFGTNEGAYIESPEFQPSDQYDPRVRPWYFNAMNADDVVITAPYLTKFTQDLVVSLIKRVDRNGDFIGVAGISVSLDTISNNIVNISNNDHGYMVVLDKNNTVLIDPLHPEWQLKTLPQTGESALTSLTFENGEVHEAQIDGQDKILCTYTSPYSGWKYIVINEKHMVVDKAKIMTNIIILVYTLTLLIIFVFVYLFSKSITNPILEITESINHLSKFNFDKEESLKTLKYIKQTDEIGIMSRAIVNMRNNYKELSLNIDGLDNELKRIDISKSTSYQLTLSEKNPFNNFTVSVNKLLTHINHYFNDMKASEEELIAQLDEINRQKEYINFVAEHDPLTNLPNRRLFLEVLANHLEGGSKGAVILLDLDNFKSINDTLGHVFGDKVLKYLADEILKLANENTFFSRFGGDEFLMLCLDNEEKGLINVLINEIQEIFKKRILIDGNEVDLNFSMGITKFPEDSSDVNQLIMNADMALYSVKNRGKNGYKFFKSNMTEHLLEKSKIENAIRDAIEHDGFYVVYQPQINLKTGKIMALEALVRLSSGLYLPDAFIPVAEENGSIIKIGRIVASKVISQLAIWRARGLEVMPVAINFSVVQTHDKKFLSFLKEQLEIYNIPADLIEIEITENVLIDNRDSALSLIQALKDMGIGISIDDFGTGYSSLSYLTFLPLDKIKLDRSLSMKFLEIENIKVMDSLIQLAHSLNFTVVAEGIEEREHVRRLKIGVCDAIQGYYFSRPLEAADVESALGRSFEALIDF